MTADSQGPVETVNLQKFRFERDKRNLIGRLLKLAVSAPIIAIPGMVVTRLCGMSTLESAVLGPFGLRAQESAPIFATHQSFVANILQAASIIVSTYFLLICCVIPGAACLLLANSSRFRLSLRTIPPLAGTLAMWHFGLICLLSGITLFFSGEGFLKSVIFGSLVGGFGLKVLPAGSTSFEVAKQKMLRLPDELLVPQRPRPILYLRPFVEDQKVPKAELRRDYDTGKGLSLDFYTDQRRLTFEEILCDGLGSVAPVIALERPGASSLSLGAARLAVQTDRWQEEIIRLTDRCRFSAMVTGCSPGILWELNRLISTNSSAKLLLILTDERPSNSWIEFTKLVAQICQTIELPAVLPASALAVAFRTNWRPVVLLGPASVVGFARVAQWMDSRFDEG